MRAAGLDVLVVDDEEYARARLCELLQQEPSVEVVRECATVPEAVDAIRTRRPDVVFLDIQIRAASGFDVIEEIGARDMPLVVFVTAFDEYAIRAFDVHAVDYLLKPFDAARFRQALRRATAALQSADRSAIAESLRALVAEVAEARRTAGAAAELPTRIVVKSGDRSMQVVETTRIAWIEAAGNYVVLHSDSGRTLHREPLVALEKRLDPRQFVRVHRSALVNLTYVETVTPWSGGDYTIQLKDGTQVRLSRTFREAFEQRLEQIAR